VNVYARLCCLAHAGIKVSSHDLLWNYTDVLSSVDLPLKQFLCCLSSDQATYIISIGSKGHTTSHVWSLFLDFDGDFTHTCSLCILSCKSEALELFSVGRQLISSQNGDLFPLLLKCRSLFICSFI
jgi:hypothetical protein